MEAFVAALEGNTLVAALRASRYAYPLVNVGHVLGLATLFGAILLLDLRLLGVAPSVDAEALAGLAVPIAAAGLALAVATGALLFAVRAGEYLESPAFLAKMAFVGLGLANAIGQRASGLAARLPRLAATVSLVAWTGALIAGRLIGYLEA